MKKVKIEGEQTFVRNAIDVGNKEISGKTLNYCENEPNVMNNKVCTTDGL